MIPLPRDSDSPSDILRLLEAANFAAKVHANQRRKGAAQEPYINHLLEVALMVAEATGGADLDVVLGAVFHDAVEDTALSYDDLSRRYGARVADLVRENSDDMSLPKDERKRRRIQLAAQKSDDAKIIKTADVISNIRAMVSSPPAGWPLEWKLGYLDGTRKLHDAMRGANPSLDALFDREVAAAETELRDQAEQATESGTEIPEHALDPSSGQPVHTIYMPNTEARPLTDADKDRFAARVMERFPSAIIQEADGIYEGKRRPIMTVHFRTDSTEGVIALAQRICLDFEQRFVGVEFGNKYFRIYADDTG